MNPQIVLHDFLTEFSALHVNQIECSIYLFGSILRDTSCSSDLDILIIYQHGIELKRLKQLLTPICLKYPVDLICMTPSEEAQLDFIAKQHAILVSKIAM